MTEFIATTPRFGRSAIATVLAGTAPILTVHGYDESSFSPFGLRMAFKVERKISSVADTATVRIWNLGAASRALLAQWSLVFARKDPLRYIRLEVGYKDITGADTKGVIFNGAITRAINTRDGADWITEIEASSVFGQSLLNVLDRPWAAPTPVRNIVQELLSVAGFTAVRFSPQAETVLANKIEQSYATTGSAYEAVRKLLDSHGLTFNADVDGVTVYAPGFPRQASVLQLSEATGLIGSPRISNLGADFRTLIDPKIRPGQLMTVDSQTLRDTVTDPSLGRQFTAWSVQCVGDTHTNDWYCDVTAWFFPPLVDAALAVQGSSITGG